MIQWHFAKCNIFMGKVAWNFYLTHGLRHNCIIDQSATENKVIHTLIINFFSHGLRSVKIEQELEKHFYSPTFTKKNHQSNLDHKKIDINLKCSSTHKTKTKTNYQSNLNLAKLTCSLISHKYKKKMSRPECS